MCWTWAVDWLIGFAATHTVESTLIAWLRVDVYGRSIVWLIDWLTDCVVGANLFFWTLCRRWTDPEASICYFLAWILYFAMAGEVPSRLEHRIITFDEWKSNSPPSLVESLCTSFLRNLPHFCEARNGLLYLKPHVRIPVGASDVLLEMYVRMRHQVDLSAFGDIKRVAEAEDDAFITIFLQSRPGSAADPSAPSPTGRSETHGRCGQRPPAGSSRFGRAQRQRVGQFRLGKFPFSLSTFPKHILSTILSTFGNTCLFHSFFTLFISKFHFYKSIFHVFFPKKFF